MELFTYNAVGGRLSEVMRIVINKCRYVYVNFKTS